jgi:enoyl-[acyl-carrier protein] reductase I
MVGNKLLSGKRGIIMGVANERSIAYGIARACHAQGAELCFTYQGESLLKRITPIAQEMDSEFILECNVTSSASIIEIFEKVAAKWGKIDFIVHSIAYSNKDELKGHYLDTSLENFTNTMHISCFSFVEIARHASPIMNDGGSLVALTYYGAEKAVPNYNVMGVAKAALEASVRYMAADFGPRNIRVNAISSGPIKTLAASAIGGFNSFLKSGEAINPLRRNTTIEDVGNSAVYLLSELSSGVTGEIVHVDCGYHAVGMAASSEA